MQIIILQYDIADNRISCKISTFNPKSVKHRDRVIRALNHQPVDRPPFQATFTPEFADRLRRVYGLPAQFSEPHHREWYGYKLEELTGQDLLQASVGWSTGYYLKSENYTDEWGVEWKVDPYETPYGVGHYTNIARNPLRNDDAKAMAFKAPDPHRPEIYDNVRRLVREYGDEYYIIGRIHCTIFESAWALRGLDTLMTDFYCDPDLTNHILDETYGYHKECAMHLARIGVDMIWLGDDMGAQDAMLIDPDLWREFFKGRMAEIIRSVKEIKPDIKVAYHSDGCIYDIIPDLIEIGLDVLNPIQTECMSPEILADKYGDKLCFFGGMAVQSTLPMGTHEDIENEYKRLSGSLGRNSGWICAPTHHVQLDTPMDNFFHMLKTIGCEYVEPVMAEGKP